MLAPFVFACTALHPLPITLAPALTLARLPTLPSVLLPAALPSTTTTYTALDTDDGVVIVASMSVFGRVLATTAGTSVAGADISTMARVPLPAIAHTGHTY